MTNPQPAEEDTPPTRNRAQTSKVARLLAKYDLTELGVKLETAWTRPDDPDSLRALADLFNQRLLKEAMEDEEITPLNGEVENTYRLLTDDNVSPGAATEAQRRLERTGIDVDQLVTDFVSRQAIHTYLTKVRGVRKQSNGGNPVENAETYLRNLKQRTATITDSRLTQLRDADHLSIHSPRTLVDIQILCEECGQQHSLEELFTAEPCSCYTNNNR